jgi:hypothetical protein
MDALVMTESELLRHCLATIAYRAGRTFEGAPEGFARQASGGGWPPLAILAHMGDLMEWSLAMARGEARGPKGVPEAWADEVTRFHRVLERLDQFLASGLPLQVPSRQLLQGPMADALTHVGQLAMLRRMAGAPVAGESYFLADIQAGRVGLDQAPPRKPVG